MLWAIVREELQDTLSRVALLEVVESVEMPTDTLRDAMARERQDRRALEFFNGTAVAHRRDGSTVTVTALKLDRRAIESMARICIATAGKLP